jgi:hypothetical protein
MRRTELALLKSNRQPTCARRLPSRPCARKGENFGVWGRAPGESGCLWKSPTRIAEQLRKDTQKEPLTHGEADGEPTDDDG